MKKNCGCFFVLLATVCCAFVSAEDAFKKIDPDCHVWIARRKTITTQVQPLLFVTLQERDDVEVERMVIPYFPESVNLNDELREMVDQEMAENVCNTVLRQMDAEEKPTSEWIPVAPVKEFGGDFQEPDRTGYYMANLAVDYDKDEEYRRRSRLLVVVARKKNGTLAAMQAGSIYAAPLRDYCRWSGEVSIGKANAGIAEEK